MRRHHRLTYAVVNQFPIAYSLQISSWWCWCWQMFEMHANMCAAWSTTRLSNGNYVCCCHSAYTSAAASHVRLIKITIVDISHPYAASTAYMRPMPAFNACQKLMCYQFIVFINSYLDFYAGKDKIVHRETNFKLETVHKNVDRKQFHQFPKCAIHGRCLTTAEHYWKLQRMRERKKLSNIHRCTTPTVPLQLNVNQIKHQS